jgi:hypothetical protein
LEGGGFQGLPCRGFRKNIFQGWILLYEKPFHAAFQSDSNVDQQIAGIASIEQISKAHF